MARRISCKTVLSLLARDLSGALGVPQARQVAEHVRVCRSCAIAYESAHETVERMSGTGFHDGRSESAYSIRLASVLADGATCGGGEK